MTIYENLVKGCLYKEVWSWSFIIRLDFYNLFGTDERTKNENKEDYIDKK